MSKPTTPKRRRSHRSSGLFNIISQSPKVHYPIDPENLPLESQANTEKFEKLSDSMEELEGNMTNLQQIHESLALEFNESFASFLYGLSMTMWCVHFPGKPSKDQWEKVELIEGLDDRIAELKSKLKVSREENQNLKKRLSGPRATAYNAAGGGASSSGLRGKKKLGFTDVDDTSESFVMNPGASSSSTSKVTKIPRRAGETATDRSARPGARVRGAPARPTTTVRSNPGTGPNLNQPPRYMRGLFDSTNTRAPTKSDDYNRTRRPINRSTGTRNYR